MDLPSTERFKASSDFELKLVTMRSLGTASVPIFLQSVVRLSRKMGEVTPKLPSDLSLSKTLGYFPSAVAVAHATFTGVVPPASSGTLTVLATQPGGSVWPMVTVAALPA